MFGLWHDACRKAWFDGGWSQPQRAAFLTRSYCTDSLQRFSNPHTMTSTLGEIRVSSDIRTTEDECPSPKQARACSDVAQWSEPEVQTLSTQRPRRAPFQRAVEFKGPYIGHSSRCPLSLNCKLRYERFWQVGGCVDCRIGSCSVQCEVYVISGFCKDFLCRADRSVMWASIQGPLQEGIYCSSKIPFLRFVRVSSLK